jgi:hypothetical protein
VPAQLNDPVAALPGMGNRAQPGVDVNNPRAESQKFFDSTDLQNRLREVYDTVNRNNTSIYAVDPRGLAAFEYDINQGVGLQTDRSNLNASIDSLRVLADNTDGRAIVNRNDLAAGMKQIMRDASGYYLLGYTSSSAPTDGKFHTIDVRVKRPNVEVRSRRGYWAVYRGGRGARECAAQARTAAGDRQRAERDRRANQGGACRALLDGNGSGGRRQDAGDVRLGGAGDGGDERGLARARDGVAGDADGDRGRRAPALSWSGRSARAVRRRRRGSAGRARRQRQLLDRARSDRVADRRPERGGADH